MPKRLALSAVILVLVICLLPPGGQETAAQTATPTETPPELRIIAIEESPSDTDFEPLRKLVDEVSFKDAPLDQCIAWFSSIVDANLVVRYQTLEEAGIERDKPITFQGRGLTAAQVLWLVLDEAGSADRLLGFEGFENGLLVVSTLDDLDRDQAIRIYDVSALLQACDEYREASELRRERHLAEIRELGGPTPSGGSNNIFRGAASQACTHHATKPRLTPSEQRLHEVIVNVVRPDSWAENGGTGTLDYVNGALVVRNSRSVHRQLGAFLHALAEMTVGQP